MHGARLPGRRSPAALSPGAFRPPPAPAEFSRLAPEWPSRAADLNWRGQPPAFVAATPHEPRHRPAADLPPQPPLVAPDCSRCHSPRPNSPGAASAPDTRDNFAVPARCRANTAAPPSPGSATPARNPVFPLPPPQKIAPLHADGRAQCRVSPKPFKASALLGLR